MSLKLPVRSKLSVRSKFFLAYSFVGHEFSQEKVLKKPRSYRDYRKKWWTSLAPMKWSQNLLCLCYWALKSDPLTLVARWTALSQEQAEIENKHFLETRVARGTGWLYPHTGSNHGPIYLARHDVCMYNPIKYPKVLLSRDYGVSLCSAACTSLERQPLWRKMACCSYQFPSPKWILHFSQRHTLGLSLVLTKGLCLGALA